jgi:hypothetical protein
MLSLFAILAAAAGGTVCLGFAEPEARLVLRLAGGVALGVALLGLVGLVLASLFGLTPLVVLASAALVAGVPLAVARLARTEAARRRRARAAAPSRPLIAYFAVFLVFLGVFFAKAAYERHGAILTGEWNNLGDLAFHVGIVEGFVQGQNFPPEHPEFAGARLTYPFLCDFVTAMLVVGGMPLLAAMYVQNLLLAFVLLALLYRWTSALTRDRLAAMLLPVVVLFCGGLGVYTFVWESQASGRPLVDFFLKPPHAVTILWDQYGEVLRWGNALTAFFLPQRAWLVGLPLALLVWTWWWQALAPAPRPYATLPEGERMQVLAEARDRRRKLLAAGLVAGLLPLAHAHSYMVMMAMGAALTLLYHRRWREWALFLAAGTAVALPQLLWISHGAQAQAGSFLAWHYGWARPENASMSLVTFWLVNTGITLPLAVAAFLWRGEPRLVPTRLAFFLLPFAFCLVVPNFIKLSPWEWDTNKVLFYGYLALVVPISLLLARLLRGRVWMKAAGAVALVLLTMSGAVDVWRVVSGTEEWTQFDADTVAQARLIEQKTPPRARILSAFGSSRATLLTGRRSLVGHPWTMWSHGLPAEARLADMRRIFAGEPGADALLKQYAVDYVLIGPAERSELSPNEGYFARFEIAGEAGGARLYRIARS